MSGKQPVAFKDYRRCKIGPYAPGEIRDVLKALKARAKGDHASVDWRAWDLIRRLLDAATSEAREKACVSAAMAAAVLASDEQRRQAAEMRRLIHMQRVMLSRADQGERG